MGVVPVVPDGPPPVLAAGADVQGLAVFLLAYALPLIAVYVVAVAVVAIATLRKAWS